MKYQDHSPATSLCTLKASFIDARLIVSRAQYSTCFNVGGFGDTNLGMVVITRLRSGAAANAPKDSVHSITAASAILLFFMIVILLFGK
jgi:hypothetical protein